MEGTSIHLGLGISLVVNNRNFVYCCPNSSSNEIIDIKIRLQKGFVLSLLSIFIWGKNLLFWRFQAIVGCALPDITSKS